MLVILFATEGTWVARLLAWRGFVAIGLISYSAYLWHQPILSLARIRLIEPSQMQMVALIALTFGLAWVSWRFVEQPFRARNATGYKLARSWTFGATGFAMAGFVVWSSYWLLGSGIAAQSIKANPGIATYMAYEDYNRAFFNADCFLSKSRGDFARFDKEQCLKLATDRPNVLVMGNSYAAHLVTGLRTRFPGVNFLQAVASGCTGLLPLHGEQRCTDLFNYIYDEFLPRQQLDAIILSSLVQLEDIPSYPATVEALAERTRQGVLVVGPTFEFQPALYLVMANALRFSVARDAAQSAQAYLAPDRAKMDLLVAKALDGFAGVHYASVFKRFCRPDCPVFSTVGELFTFDTGHYTRSGALDVAESLRGDLTLMRIVSPQD